MGLGRRGVLDVRRSESPRPIYRDKKIIGFTELDGAPLGPITMHGFCLSGNGRAVSQRSFFISISDLDSSHRTVARGFNQAMTRSAGECDVDQPGMAKYVMLKPEVVKKSNG